jgi:hypothetical protein
MQRQVSDFERAARASKASNAAFKTQQSFGFQCRIVKYDYRIPCQPGDMIWAVPGVDVPLILRREDEHYVFIGECYLHRALLDHICHNCGGSAGPWKMRTELIEIW